MISERDGFLLTDEPLRFDLPAIAALVQSAYWAAERSVEQIAESLTHSTCLVLTRDGATVGFVRAISDYSVNSYICDFVIVPEHQSRGLGTWMLETLMAHPALARTSQFLVTFDAQKFYERHGFAPHPYQCMKRPRQSPA
jgi:GNAT superfamily N-acetyltransferase